MNRGRRYCQEYHRHQKDNERDTHSLPQDSESWTIHHLFFFSSEHDCRLSRLVYHHACDINCIITCYRRLSKTVTREVTSALAVLSAASELAGDTTRHGTDLCLVGDSDIVYN